MTTSDICPRCGQSHVVALAPELIPGGWYACRHCGHLWKTQPGAPVNTPHMAEYDCALCDQPIADDPFWCHPVMANKAHADEVVALGARILKAPVPPVEIAAGAMPFHKHCLEERIGRHIPD